MNSELKTNGSGKVSSLFDFFFVRKVPAIIWIFLLISAGSIGYVSMVKEALPDLEIPEAYILTRWEGATPSMMEKDVTQKIEQRLRGMKGLKKMYSSSQYELSTIAVFFRAGSPMADSLQLLERKVSAAFGDLPKNAERPKVEATSVRDIPIGSVALSASVSSSGKEICTRDDLEEQGRRMQRIFEKIPGIKKALLVGSRKKIVHVQLYPDRLRALCIPSTLVRERIVQNGFDAPWGEFEHPDLNFSMKMDGVYRDLDTIRDLVVQRRGDNGVVRVSDVVKVSKSHLRERSRASLSWEGSNFFPVVVIELMKAPGKDTMALVASVENKISEAVQSPMWPKGMKCRLVGSQAEVIQTELDRGISNGWQAMLAVFLVLFVLLTWREALVAALSIPLTLLGAIVVLWAMGYTFNLLVIVGMILALGLLVDDFILIMEGMHEGIFIKKLDFVQTVRRTIKTYALPSFSGSVTTILVFLPLAFVSGVDGKFIRIIPVTAAVCLIMSYIISIVLGPFLVRMFVVQGKEYGPGKMDRISAVAEQRLYKWLGSRVVATRRQAFYWIAAAILLFVFSILCALNLRDTLYPKEDGRGLGVTVQLEPGTELTETARIAERLENVLKEKVYFSHVIKVVGGKDAYSMSSFHDMIGKSKSPNLIGFSCFLVPGKERDRLAYEYSETIRAELEKALWDVPGARVFMTPQAGGPSGEDAVRIDLIGDDVAQLRMISMEVQNVLQRIPGVVDVRDNIGAARTELRLRPMQESMDFHKVNREELAGQMVAWMENEKVGKFRLTGVRDDLDIRLGGLWNSQKGKYAGLRDWKEMEKLSIINSEGRPVSLWTLVEPRFVEAEQVVLHKDGLRSVTVRAKLSGTYVSEVLGYMRPILDKMSRNWPVEYEYVFAGQEDVEATYMNMFKVFLLSIVLVYAVLALLFDSLLHSIIILSTVLFSLVGVFVGFFLLEIPFSFSASIGIVALVGIVVNDAIIMVETMNSHRRKGIDLFEAAKRGASDRLRPIVSTTVTNFAGLTPLALADPGWAPLCQAIIFGELTATVGAVCLIPALYVMLTR